MRDSTRSSRSSCAHARIPSAASTRQSTAARGPQRLHAAHDRAHVDRAARRSLPEASGRKLQRQLVHPTDHVFDGRQHVALKLGIVAMSFDVRKQKLQLRDEVLQVMDHECRHAMKCVELLGFQQGLGRFA